MQLQYLALAVYTIFSGATQGIITWLFIEYVKQSRQDWIDAALHYGGAATYAVVVLGLAGALAGPMPAWSWPTTTAWLLVVWQHLWPLSVAGVLIRWLLFDVSLNTAKNWFNHREGRPKVSPWAVGGSAWSDKVTRAVATLVHLEPATVRQGIWWLALGAGAALGRFA